MDLAPYAKKVYSQFTEDGRTVELVRRIDPPRFFVEIGCGDGSENNTRILAEQKWSGLWIDAEPANCVTATQIADPLGVQVLCSHISLDNTAWLSGRVARNFGLLSIDIDGNDYHIWKALCGGQYGLRPSVVIIEAQIQKPFDLPFVMPYDKGFVWDHASQEIGASVYSMTELGKELGYTLVGKCPDYHSPNIFFVRDEFADLVKD